MNRQRKLIEERAVLSQTTFVEEEDGQLHLNKDGFVHVYIDYFEWSSSGLRELEFLMERHF